MFEQKYDLLFLAHQTTTIFAWILFQIFTYIFANVNCHKWTVNMTKKHLSFSVSYFVDGRKREREMRKFASKNQVTHLGTCHLNIFAEQSFNFVMWQNVWNGICVEFFFYTKLLSNTTAHSVLELGRCGSATDGLYSCSYVKRILFATREHVASKKKQPLSRTQFHVFVHPLIVLIVSTPYNHGAVSPIKVLATQRKQTGRYIANDCFYFRSQRQILIK